MASEVPGVAVLAELARRADVAITPASIADRGPAEAAALGGVAAGPWPSWALPQLERAIELAAAAGDGLGVARLLYRQWFSPRAGGPGGLAVRPRALAGVYRRAHAGSAIRRRGGEVPVVDRHDVIGVDGWWRTWGDAWTPPRTRPGSVRLLLTPRPDRLAEFVAVVTGRLLREPMPWSLSCATDPRRIARTGGAVLDLPGLDRIPGDLVDALAPMLRPVAPPLALPVAPGIAAAEHPDNGMTFGEHRCHLIALALRHPCSGRDPLRTIAAVFRAHGLDPRRPYRAR